MKKIIIMVVLVLVLGLKVGNAQVSTDAPLLTAIWNTLITSQSTQFASLQELIQQKMQTAMKNKEFISKLKTMKKIKDLIEDLTCQMDELNINIHYIRTEDCLIKLNINMTLLNIQHSSELLNWVFVAGNLLMDQQGQNTTLDIIKNSLEKSIKELGALNNRISLSVNDQVEKMLLEENVYNVQQGFSYGRR